MTACNNDKRENHPRTALQATNGKRARIIQGPPCKQRMTKERIIQGPSCNNKRENHPMTALQATGAAHAPLLPLALSPRGARFSGRSAFRSSGCPALSAKQKTLLWLFVV